MTIGWYGKIPARGDFVSRDIEPAMLRDLDAWLQRGLQHAGEVLGAADFGARLRALPAWRWLAWPDGPANHLWAGVLIASSDRVGRAFPFLLAQPLTRERLVQLGWTGIESGFARFTQAALAVAEPGGGTDLEDLSDRLRQVFDAPAVAQESARAPSRKRRSALQLLDDSPGTASLWWTAPAARTAPVPLGDAWPPHPELLLDLLGDLRGDLLGDTDAVV